MNKKASAFFVFDVFIAATILVITLTIILSSSVERPKTEQTQVLSQDMMQFLGDNKLKDINNQKIDDLAADGNITDLDQSPLEQIALLYHRAVNEPCSTCLNNASHLFESLTISIIPQQYNVYFFIEDQLIHERTNAALETTFSYSTKRITYPQEDKFTLVGPYTAELQIEG
tara:strand:- start:41 stop:556 length:516 start_codon:yes stop_codon:yes gene_type:complete